jgi:hypothetical protein
MGARAIAWAVTKPRASLVDGGLAAPGCPAGLADLIGMRPTGGVLLAPPGASARTRPDLPTRAGESGSSREPMPDPRASASLGGRRGALI